MKKLVAFVLTTVMTLTSCITSSFAKTDILEDVSTETQNAELAETSTSILAFPGAEGGGKFATGGRGGKIYHVTNLNDSGTGSFRDAVSGSNRIVVFDVGGTIELKSDVVVKDNITIAGQTAPGGKGITLKNYKIGLGGDNIIIRYVSSRPGERGTTADYDAWGGAKGSNSIIDHCSLGWSNDEQWGLYSGNVNYTVQYTIIGPANSFSYHSKGIHGFGIMFGKGQGSWHHNLVVHNISRNFRGKVEGTSVMDYVNNVIYDWGYQTAYGTFGHVNYANNYYKAGNSTSGAYKYITFSSGSNVEKYKFYLTGNKMYKADGSLYNDENNNWKLVDYGGVTSTYGYDEAYYRTDTYMPLKVNNVDVSVVPNMDTADVAFDKVTKYAGAGISQNCKPKIDIEVCNDAINGTGYITGARPLSEANSTQQAEIKKNSIHQIDYSQYYPEAVTKKEIVDSDNDGMPDEWELARGLNPNDASDATKDYAGQGYNNIEYYINDLTINSFPEGVVTISPTVKNNVTVDASKDEVEGENYKTVAAAIAYMKENEASMVKGRKIIYVAPGTYNEVISLDLSTVSIMPLENSTGKVTFNGITISKNVTDVVIDDIYFNGDVNVLGDRTQINDCNITGNVSMSEKARAYIKNCSITGTVSADSRAVFNKCTISATDFVAKSTREADDKYGILIMNSEIIGSGNTLLADTTGSNGQVVYYNCKISNVADKSSVSGTSSTRIRISNCQMGDVVPAYSENLSVYDYGERFTPFIHLKTKYGSSADNWNPDSFDEVTPQEKLQLIADSISVQKTMIVKNVSVASSVDGDPDIKISWTCSDPSCFSDNTIIAGEYGTGVKYATLTATVSKEGYQDVIKTFDIIVGSQTEDTEGLIDFEECVIGGDSEYLKMTASYSKNDKVTWGVVEDINGQSIDGHGKVYQVKQSQATNVDASVDPGKGIYDFTYNFGKNGDKVVEVDFDIYVGDITDDSYFDVYLRGSNTLGQLRISSDSIEVYTNSTSKSTLKIDLSKWYKVKMIVSTEGLSSGTEPKIDYYLYDESGKQVGKVLGASPAKAFDAANTDAFIPDRIVFRPNRNYDVCEFYVDNIQYKNLTDVAAADAEEISESYVMNVGDRLPAYGNRLSNITWKVIDGQTDVINSDGTINYDKCGVTAIKARGTVSFGDSLKGTATTKDIIIVVNGTGENKEVVSDKFFSDIDDFSSWIKQYNTSAIGILLDDTTDVSGNSTQKIKLPNKAVFKNFENPANSGKVTFTTDFLATDTGRTFRIFFENAATEDDGNGYGKADFVTTNIMYHLTDIGGVTSVITSDTPGAKDATTPYTDVTLGTLEPNKWYRIKVDVDLDNKTTTTSAYLHGTDGTYNTSAISETPVGTASANLISKTPLELKQIRLVKTSAGIVYFDNVSVSGELNVTGVTLTPKTLKLKPTETSQLYAIVSPNDATNKKVKWSSTDEKVATVSDAGLVTAVAEGTATIKVTTEDGSFSEECVVTVDGSKVNVTGVTLTPKAVQLKPTETSQLNAVVSPDNAENKKVKWSSTDEKVATVSDTGLVTAVAEGTATIKVTTEDGSFSEECVVTVKSDKVISIGDVDGNGEIEVLDAMMTLKYVLDKNTENISADNIKRMKVTKNDAITAKDVAAILNKALNKDFKFEID